MPKNEKKNINQLMTETENVFTESALATFGTYTHRTPRNKYNQRWFNNTCRTARQKYYLARKSYALNKTVHNKETLSNASKQYKNTLKRSILNYKRALRQKIRNMRQTSPKEYWKYINSVNKKTSDPDMNGTEPSDTNIPNSDFPEFLEETYLNNAICVDEIEKAIRGLKNNKASGLDKITNEYIKSTSSIFLPIYHKLFTIVLDTGILPDAWLIGVIKPIYKNKGNPDDSIVTGQ